VAHNLQKKFAAATTVNQLPAKGAGLVQSFCFSHKIRTSDVAQEVQVQGNFLHELEEYLITQYSIPNKYIEVTDKTRKK
jgi:translation initiation factor 1 (eIF-1/SUI1)